MCLIDHVESFPHTYRTIINSIYTFGGREKRSRKRHIILFFHLSDRGFLIKEAFNTTYLVENIVCFICLESTMCDRTETRMQIRRNRSPNSPNSRSMMLSLSVCDDTSEQLSSTTSRYRRTSFPASSTTFEYNSTVADDIERRRRRIRSISNSVPPLPVSSIYRGYLPKSNSVSTTNKATDEVDARTDPSRLTKLNGIIKRRMGFQIKVFNKKLA